MLFLKRNFAVENSTLSGTPTVKPDSSKRVDEIAAMFDRVAPGYDFLNTLLSLGQVGIWRRAVCVAIDPQPGQNVLDVAAGTGTSAEQLRGYGLDAVALDISEGMLEVGRLQYPHVNFEWGSATELPFEDDTFDAVTISFGIRNVDDVPKALAEMYRVTKPGGRLVVCEFSQPRIPVRPFHRTYLTRIAPTLARFFTPVGEAYDYLSESIIEWYDQKEFGNLMYDAGWQDVSYRNLTYGSVAIHRGFKAE